MDILVVDDDPTVRALLVRTLAPLGHRLDVAGDGAEALRRWQAVHHSLVVTDWLMPGLDGPALCQHIRRAPEPDYTYVIMVTACDRHQDIVAGLAAGADDYVAKPFHCEELLMRVRAGLRVIGLEGELRAKVAALQAALDRVRTLEGLLPICAHCKQIRDAQGNWHPLEAYIQERTDALFSHGVCPRCLTEHFGMQLQDLQRPTGE